MITFEICTLDVCLWCTSFEVDIKKRKEKKNSKKQNSVWCYLVLKCEHLHFFEAKKEKNPYQKHVQNKIETKCKDWISSKKKRKEKETQLITVHTNLIQLKVVATEDRKEFELWEFPCLSYPFVV